MAKKKNTLMNLQTTRCSSKALEGNVLKMRKEVITETRLLVPRFVTLETNMTSFMNLLILWSLELNGTTVKKKCSSYLSKNTHRLVYIDHYVKVAWVNNRGFV